MLHEKVFHVNNKKIETNDAASKKYFGRKKLYFQYASHKCWSQTCVGNKLLLEKEKHCTMLHFCGKLKNIRQQSQIVSYKKSKYIVNV